MYETTRRDRIKIGDEKYSYRQIVQHSLGVASTLKKWVSRARSWLVGQRNAAAYFGLLGIIFSGSHYIPINKKYSIDKKLKIIDSDIRVVVRV